MGMEWGFVVGVMGDVGFLDVELVDVNFVVVVLELAASVDPLNYDKKLIELGGLIF